MAEREAEAEIPADRDLVFRDFYDAMQRRYLRSLITPEVIDEHRRKPLGQHSEPLERLLHYFRERPLAGSYAVLRERENCGFRIVALSGVRGVPPRAVDEERHATVEAAYHAIFLRRIEELKGEDVG